MIWLSGKEFGLHKLEDDIKLYSACNWSSLDHILFSDSKSLLLGPEDIKDEARIWGVW